MRSRSQNHSSEGPRFSREELRTIFWFWFFWSAYALLSAILIAALTTAWPSFLHDASPFGR